MEQDFPVIPERSISEGIPFSRKNFSGKVSSTGSIVFSVQKESAPGFGPFESHFHVMITAQFMTLDSDW